MATDCCHVDPSAPDPAPSSGRFRRALWIALAVNASMFLLEVAAGWQATSVALLADAVDFFGDSVSYGVSLFVLALAPVWRSRTALLKGWVMGGFGVFVLAQAAFSFARGGVPEAGTMGAVGLLALLANLSVAAVLYAYRDGDANMRSVWLCTRNDAIGNVAVLLAAVGVFGTGSGWPDLVVASIMGVLSLLAARSVIARAGEELRAQRHIPAARVED